MNFGFGVIPAESLMYEPTNYRWKWKFAHGMQPNPGIIPDVDNTSRTMPLACDAVG